MKYIMFVEEVISLKDLINLIQKFTKKKLT